MTALAADAQRNKQEGHFLTYPVYTGTTIYKNSIVALNSSGYAIPATDTAGLTVVGVATSKVVNAGSSGAKSIQVQIGARWKVACTSITQAMVGSAMYVVDDNTVDDAAGATNDVFAGILVEYLSTSLGWVLIGPSALPFAGFTGSVSDLNKLDTLTGYPIEAAEVTFTETSGSGVYTGAVALPAGATILDIIINGVALWDNAGTVTMKVGDTDDDGYYTAINLKATDLLAGESLSFALAGGKAGAYIANSQVSPRYNAGAVTINGIITTSSTGGTAGRTRMVVVYVLPTSTAAVKV